MSDDDDNVVFLHDRTGNDLPVQRILNEALKQDLESVIVIGQKDGEMYIASSSGDGRELLWEIESFKFNLLSGMYSIDEDF